jgi:hypothetical protein
MAGSKIKSMSRAATMLDLIPVFNVLLKGMAGFV